jgi:hypothetical protein
MAATLYRRKRGPRRFGQKLDSEDSMERSRRGHPGDLITRGKALGLYPIRSLAPVRGSNED